MRWVLAAVSDRYVNVVRSARRPNDARIGKGLPLRDMQTGGAVAAASHVLRSASIGALPSSTLRSITDAAAALSEVPSLQTLALASIQPNVAMMHTAGLAAKVGAQYDVPVIARLAAELASIRVRLF